MVRLVFLGALFAVATTAEQQLQTAPSPSEVVAGVGGVPNEVGRAGWEDLYDEDRVYRVRETLFAPAPGRTASPRSTTAVEPVVAPPAPHIAATLKPLFRYLIHHPVRAIVKTAPAVVRYGWTSLKYAVYHLGRFTVVTLYALFATPTLVLLRPVIFAYRLAASLQALWFTALGAILAGSGLGALAGLVTGRQARTIIDRWSGRGGAKSSESGPDGATSTSGSARAKLERIDIKDKRRAMDGVGLGSEPYVPLDGAGVPEPNWYDVGATSRAARTGEWKGYVAPLDDDAFEDDSEEDYDDDTVRAPESGAGSGSSGSGRTGSSSSGSSNGTAAGTTSAGARRG